MFADDTLMYDHCSDISGESHCCRLGNDVPRLDTWASEWCTTFNASNPLTCWSPVITAYEMSLDLFQVCPSQVMSFPWLGLQSILESACRAPFHGRSTWPDLFIASNSRCSRWNVLPVALVPKALSHVHDGRGNKGRGIRTRAKRKLWKWKFLESPRKNSREPDRSMWLSPKYGCKWAVGSSTRSSPRSAGLVHADSQPVEACAVALSRCS